MEMQCKGKLYICEQWGKSCELHGLYYNIIKIEILIDTDFVVIRSCVSEKRIVPYIRGKNIVE